MSRREIKAQGIKVTRQKILKGVNGYAMPGQTLYIMGSSGAGKTSLLNMISDRISLRNGATSSGTVMINDKTKLTNSVFGNLAAYVMQDDILYQHFTPREALIFAAKLKLGGSDKIQNERVNHLLEELGLSQIADTVIGGVFNKTISGGERKRTAIGVELITDPSLILLDEPTSGLDSFKALSIVKLLRSQARKGKTVIATIHQPSSEAFACFDRLILMMDGNIVYQGDALNSILYFKQMDFVCSSTTNPADFYMRILSVNYPKTPEDEKKILTFTD